MVIVVTLHTCTCEIKIQPPPPPPPTHTHTQAVHYSIWMIANDSEGACPSMCGTNTVGNFQRQNILSIMSKKNLRIKFQIFIFRTLARSLVPRLSPENKDNWHSLACLELTKYYTFRETQEFSVGTNESVVIHM